MAKTSSGERFVQHFGLIRLRLIGSGNLRMRLLSLSIAKENDLNPIVMTGSTNIEPTKLCNFNQQRAQLEIKTTAIDEIFSISEITIFVKPIAGSFPQ